LATEFAVSLVLKSSGLNNIQQFQRQLQQVQGAASGAQAGLTGVGGAAKGAAGAMSGLGAAVGAALGPLLSVAAALGTVKKGLDVAFERGAAEQKLRNFTDSTGEFEAAMGAAAQASSRFGISQTEATGALAETYGRLKGLGFGLKETTEIYTGFNAIAQQSGVTAEDASGAFLQLSQALGSGKLQGDELRAILERMPQLAQAIAQSMGVSAGEIRQMGQEGKITSEVIYQALSGAAEGADQLGSKLNEQQQAMKALGQVSDQLLNTIGQVFAPVVISGAEALAAAGQVLADWWDYIGGVVFPQVYQAIKPVINELQFAFRDLDLEPFRVFLQNVLIKGFQVVTGVVGNFAKVLGFVINAMRAMAQNPVFKFIAEQVGRLANFLGLTNDRVGEFNQKQDEAKQAAAATVNQYSNLPPVVANAKEEAKQLAAAFEQGKTAIQGQYAALQANLNLLLQQADNADRVTQARLTAEQAINNAQIQSLQTALQKAATDEDRKNIAEQIYQLEIANAQAVYQATLSQIDAEVRKAQIAQQTAQLRVKEMQAVLQLAIAQKQVTTAHFAALQAAQEAAGLANQNLAATRQIAGYQRQGATAAFDAATQAARVNYETNSAAKAAAQFAGGMQAAAGAASSVASSMNSAGKSAGGSYGGSGTGRLYGYDFGNAGKDPAFERAVVATVQDLLKTYGNRGMFDRLFHEAMGGFMRQANKTNGKVPGYASGGYVSGPTLATIGEGGEAEYVIPASKMGAAMANYAAGRRGDSVLNPQVNITTGPVTQMGGVNYVTQQDLMSATASAAKQGASMALGMLRSNPATRRTVGLR
jgi:tape measure domain-containing protein